MMIKMIHMLFAAHVGCFLVMGDPIYHLHYSIVHHLNSESCRERRDPNCEMCHIRLDWVGSKSVEIFCKLHKFWRRCRLDLPWCWCCVCVKLTMLIQDNGECCVMFLGVSPHVFLSHQSLRWHAEVFSVPRRAARRTLAACNRCWRTEAEKRKKAFAIWSPSSLGFCTWFPGLDDWIWVWVKIGFQKNWMVNTRLLDIYVIALHPKHHVI